MEEVGQELVDCKIRFYSHSQRRSQVLFSSIMQTIRIHDRRVEKKFDVEDVVYFSAVNFLCFRSVHFSWPRQCSVLKAKLCSKNFEKALEQQESSKVQKRATKVKNNEQYI